jgi:hypothetical protein
VATIAIMLQIIVGRYQYVTGDELLNIAQEIPTPKIRIILANKNKYQVHLIML